MLAITPRQREYFDFIKAFQQANGKSPSVREIGAALGVRSTNGVIEQLRRLEAKGWLTLTYKDGKVATRSIRLLRETEQPLPEVVLVQALDTVINEYNGQWTGRDRRFHLGTVLRDVKRRLEVLAE